MTNKNFITIELAQGQEIYWSLGCINEFIYGLLFIRSLCMRKNLVGIAQSFM